MDRHRRALSNRATTWLALGVCALLLLSTLTTMSWLRGGVAYRLWLVNLYEPVERGERRHGAGTVGNSHAPIMMEAHHRKRWAWLPIAETIHRSERRDLAAKRAREER